jgi:hypothetical protein
MKTLLGMLCSGLLPCAVGAPPVPVTIERTQDGYRLLRDGHPYYIKGAGGSSFLVELAAAGGNSVRTWSIPQTEALLPEIARLGLTVAAGVWIEHERHGFDYADAAAVAAQIERHKREIDRIRAHPAIIVWGIGNEVSINASHPGVWDVIEAVAAYIKEVDPLRPTMTVLPHVSAREVAAIRARCPSIDILGLNSYGGVDVVMRDARRAGWSGPVLITEWGTDGPWESPSTAWGAEIEPDSSAKADRIRARYARIKEDPQCLGSYVFLWGSKQENTPTWFNLFLEDGSATGAVDALQELWTGTIPETPAPRISPLLLNGLAAAGSPSFVPGQPLAATFTLASPEPAEVRVRWECLAESTDKRIGGDTEQRPRTVALAWSHPEPQVAHFRAPAAPGAYRLFVYVTSPAGKAATANIPFLVTPAPAATGPAY